MSFYLSQVLSVFLLPAMLFGLLWEQPEDKQYKQQFWLAGCAIIAGAMTFTYLPFSQVNILTIAAIDAAALILLLAYALLFRARSYVLLVWQTLILALAGFMWAKIAKLNMLSATNVINTEFILNLSALLGGFILTGFIHVLSTLLAARRNRTLINTLITLLILIALLPLSGEIILAAMKLQVLPLTQTMLSYVSRVINFYWIYPYCVLIFCVICLLVLYRSDIMPLKQQTAAQTDAISKRKHQAKLNSRWRLARHYAVAIVLTFSSLLYWDLVASQPLQRTPGEKITLAADGFVHVPVTKALEDGKIHRYEWIASDGKVVRFFVIDRYPGEQKFGVVFDACMLCGDAGYTQAGDQVICLACGVHIFIPSIGKPGGCNPIPIPQWQRKGNDILIAKKTLETGLKYFSDVVEITVTDPVNGEKLSNTGADHTYMFGGKTYFFTSAESYEAFRENPWKYVDDPTGE
ncbi:Fe-S-containing protein [Vibrio quintilis]|uniref:YHS domain protein n=1 Tax=Vibrio quintilis TaxID=1117707 RepID=A0A1M7Z1I6_9VIBR|nr:Fe-S-containing protein [Vibrio quintilis]SHO58705.1 YHS domain protein [Vibrio quintilis]